MIDELEHKYFCILPWIHLNININGDVTPCCRIQPDVKYGSTHTDNLTDIWKSAEVKKFRNEVLSQNNKNSCKDCTQIDKTNGLSHRSVSNFVFKKHFHRSLNDSHTEIFPTYLDIRFSNVCNLKCRTCSSKYSTGWYSETNRIENTNHIEPIRLTENFNELWSSFHKILTQVESIYFAGGEPLLQDEHFLFLEKLIEHKLTHIKLTYNTNLTHLNYKNWNALDIWKNFKSVSVSASLDGHGEIAQYLRKGHQWQQIESNINKIKKQSLEIYFAIHITVSVLNVFRIPASIRFWLDHGFVTDANQLVINFVEHPKYYNINILNDREIESLKKIYLDSKESFVLPSGLNISDGINIKLSHILAKLSQEQQLEQRSEFRRITQELDKLRNENTSLIIPELEALMTEDTF
ncbi:twitch domain-containing radical SAM protein [bacterium]|nr:twitch domain-containing radical SAM protein [bacterium]